MIASMRDFNVIVFPLIGDRVSFDKLFKEFNTGKNEM